MVEKASMINDMRRRNIRYGSRSAVMELEKGRYPSSSVGKFHAMICMNDGMNLLWARLSGIGFCPEVSTVLP